MGQQPGWSPNPRRVFAVAAGAVAVLVNITPVGSSDTASYAAYGRIAALGHNPYTFRPFQLPGGGKRPTRTRSCEPVLANHTLGLRAGGDLDAAAGGGDRRGQGLADHLGPDDHDGVAFILTGYILLRTAANPVRAVLLWVANPLIIVELVIGGHLDSLLALFAIAAIVLSRRCTKMWHDVAVGLLVGVAGGIKVNAVSSRSASRSRCCTTGPGPGCSGSARSPG